MNKTKFTCVVGNLIKQTDCDAIVNSAHPSMLAGSGVCGVIHRAAGKELELYGKQFAPLSPNQAVITPAFNLNIKHIIHVSAPRHHIAADPLGELARCRRCTSSPPPISLSLESKRLRLLLFDKLLTTLSPSLIMPPIHSSPPSPPSLV
jgi:hypothetical protein